VGQLINFASLLKVVIVGNPTEQQLGQLEDNFRAINTMPDACEALRHLRQLNERHNRYPIMAFDPTSNDQPVTLQTHRTASVLKPLEPLSPADTTEVSQQREEPDMSTTLSLIGYVSDYLVQSQGNFQRTAAQKQEEQLNKQVGAQVGSNGVG
jgi:hypothetical protein